MKRQLVDYLGLVNLDQEVIQQLKKFLVEKQYRISQEILTVFPHLLPQQAIERQTPDYYADEPHSLHLLPRTLEGLADTLAETFEEKKGHPCGWIEPLKNRLNQSLWEYTEILEGCVVELYQQVRQVRLEKWTDAFINVVKAVNAILTQCIDALTLAIIRLDHPLKQWLRKFSVDHLFKKWWGIQGVDPAINKNLVKNLSYMEENFALFHADFQDYQLASKNVRVDLDQLKTYPVLSQLETGENDLYHQIYFYLKLIGTSHLKKGVREEAVRGLRFKASIATVVKLLRHYLKKLTDVLYKSSLEYKAIAKFPPEIFNDKVARLKIKVKDYSQELDGLVNLIGSYRAFLIDNDPNPYVRSRLGFSERVLGQEPKGAKQLLELSFQAEDLKIQMSRFGQSIEKSLVQKNQATANPKQEIAKLLHEMGQPLMTRHLLKEKGKKLIDEMKRADELGSREFEAISYFEETLSRAMQVDWKYHVLHDFPEFHAIYRQHHGLNPPDADPQHNFRLKRFRYFFDQIQQWVKNGDLFSHIQEVESDIHDMKTYLQDFLALIQRVAKEQSGDPFLGETIQHFRQQLLEYRYLFGLFFSTLQRQEEDSKSLRMEFIFVDQYFETIEHLLSELK